MFFLVKYLYIFVFKVLLKRSKTAALMLGLCFVWKLTPCCFRNRCTVAFRNSVPLSNCKVRGFLSLNSGSSAAATEAPSCSLKENSTLNVKKRLLRLKDFRSRYYILLNWSDQPNPPPKRHCLSVCKGFGETFSLLLYVTCKCLGPTTTLVHPFSYF